MVSFSSPYALPCCIWDRFSGMAIVAAEAAAVYDKKIYLTLTYCITKHVQVYQISRQYLCILLRSKTTTRKGALFHLSKWKTTLFSNKNRWKKKINCQMWHITVNPSKDYPHSCKSHVNLFYKVAIIASMIDIVRNIQLF